MKPIPSVDFPVIVHHQIHDEIPQVAALYQGIYEVTLNFTVGITFVPDIEVSIDAEALLLPENVDLIMTEQEARRVAVAFAAYAVLPDAERAGQEQRIVHLDSRGGDQDQPLGLATRFPDLNEDQPRPTLIFYVQPEEFAVYAQELAVLAEELTDPGSSRHVSELQDFACIRFIETRILPSPYFGAYHAYMLGR